MDEPDETYVVNLSSPSGASIVDGQGQGTITDDDPTPEVVVMDCAVGEGDAGGQPCPFHLTLTNPSGSAVTVDYATANGSATAGSDYTPAAGTVTFPGLTTGPQTVNVSVLGDPGIEGDETFVAQPVGRRRGVPPDPQGQATILDDDAASLALTELGHGSAVTADLAADPGPAADVDFYRLGQEARASYEIVLDAVSGDAAPQVLLERLASDNVTVLQTAVAVGTGSGKSLRWENLLPAMVTAQHIRVRGAGCGAACGPDDVLPDPGLRDDLLHPPVQQLRGPGLGSAHPEPGQLHDQRPGLVLGPGGRAAPRPAVQPGGQGAAGLQHRRRDRATEQERDDHGLQRRALRRPGGQGDRARAGHRLQLRHADGAATGPPGPRRSAARPSLKWTGGPSARLHTVDIHPGGS